MYLNFELFTYLNKARSQKFRILEALLHVIILMTRQQSHMTALRIESCVLLLGVLTNGQFP